MSPPYSIAVATAGVRLRGEVLRTEGEMQMGELSLER